MPIISLDTINSSPDLNKIKITNDNTKEEYELYIGFSADEAKTQFSEIFVDEYYKKGLIKKNMTIIDIGAAMGLSALYFKDYAKMIYACEPFEQVYKSAKKNTEKYKNIKVFNIGIASTTRDAVLYGYDNQPPATIELRSNVPVTSTAVVKFVAIDEFMKQNKINHVDLLKIDCEGAEYEIFSSVAFKNIASKIDYIIGEAHNQPPTTPEYIPLMLEEYGFITEWLPFNNLFHKLIVRRTNGELKEYRRDIQSLFFAYRKN